MMLINFVVAGATHIRQRFLVNLCVDRFFNAFHPSCFLLLTSVSLIARITQITLFYCKVSLCVLHNCMLCLQLPPQPHRHPVFDLSQGLQSHCTFSTFKIQHYHMFLTLLNKGLTDPSKDNQHHKIGRWKKTVFGAFLFTQPSTYTQ